jgi:hypothetical protein
VLANHTSELSTLASKLSAERRWMISGTPTTHIIGTGLGSQNNIERKAQKLYNPAIPQFVANRESVTGRTWNPEDRKDMQKLSSIFTHFLQLPQFAADHKLFTNAVSNPLLQPSPPTFGSVHIIYQLLSQNMVRHR